MTTAGMGLRRIEADDGAIANPMPGQAANKPPMRDDKGVRPIGGRGHVFAEQLAPLVQGIFAFFQGWPPFLVEMIKAQMRPGFLQIRPRRADVARECRALANASVNFEGGVERRRDYFRSLQSAPVRTANDPLDG